MLLYVIKINITTSAHFHYTYFSSHDRDPFYYNHDEHQAELFIRNIESELTPILRMTKTGWFIFFARGAGIPPRDMVLLQLPEGIYNTIFRRLGHPSDGVLVYKSV